VPIPDRLVRNLYRIGWAGAGRMPAAATTPLFRGAARYATWQEPLPIRRLRHNLSVASGRPAGDALVRDAIASYLRTFHEVLALPHWPAERVVERVHVDDEARLRALHAERGVVVALPHSGNWDLAGAWACRTGLEVTSVAEQLGEAEYAAFLRFREQLGMEILSHRDPGTIPRLIGAVRRGRVICLLADRDLGGTGLPVSWGGVPITMPAGPALVARRTGAALIPAVCRYVGADMHIALGATIEPPPGRAGLVAMTQQVADFFAARIAEQPADWHMLQRFFPDGPG
jgi:phosphatidylinositol dimannoside acyltransferase